MEARLQCPQRAGSQRSTFGPLGFSSRVEESVSKDHHVALGEVVELQRDCVTTGDRGLYIASRLTHHEPVPLQLVKEVDLSSYVESRKSAFRSGTRNLRERLGMG